MSGTGTIQGRVYNPATQQYVRNAEVRLEGTKQVTATEADGSFQFFNVAPGSATITVTYTGYRTATETFTGHRRPGRRPRDQPRQHRGWGARPGRRRPPRGLHRLERTRGQRQGDHGQRRNMNITTSVASDIFGDVTDGNVGEFLKFLPGVDVDYVESETRGPRLGGMAAQYVGVSFDGVKLASADANRTGDLGRATSFEAFSISSIESIEIAPHDQLRHGCDSPAGTINMKTRRAFERSGRRISYNCQPESQLGGVPLQEDLRPRRQEEHEGPAELGLRVFRCLLQPPPRHRAQHSHADSYTEQYRHNLTYNKTPFAGNATVPPIRGRWC
jgi:iron complex outermembrane receptor protein